ncbi:MAG: response regulator transcription factor [Thermotogota bacterium]
MDIKVFLVEDEEDLNKVLTSYLKKENWIVKSFYDGKSAELSIGEQPDLWILDIMLPDIDGYELIKEIKEKTPKTPVIFISARDAQIDRVVGLDMGSDDYLAKPFLPRELVIRAKKILERTQGYTEKTENITLSKYLINFSQRKIFDENNKDIDLTSKEFDMIAFFAKNANNAYSREKLLEKIWGYDYYGSERVVDDLIRRLRKKMPEVNIETIYGYGYRMMKK